MRRTIRVIAIAMCLAATSVPHAGAVVTAPSPPDEATITLSQPTISAGETVAVEIDGSSLERISGLMFTVSGRLEIVEDPICEFHYWAILDPAESGKSDRFGGECFIDRVDHPRGDTVVIVTINTEIGLSKDSFLERSEIRYSFDVELREDVESTSRPNILVLTGPDADGGIVKYFIDP